MARGFRMGGSFGGGGRTNNLILFEPNDEHTGVTGGFYNQGGTFTKGASLKIQSTSGWAYGLSNFPIDVTEYTQLKVTFRGSLTNAICGLVDAPTTPIDAMYQQRPSSTTVYTTFTVDISAVTGQKYFQMQAYANSFLEVGKIELIK